MSVRVANPVIDNPKVNVKVIFGLFLIHFIGDFYAAFVTPLMPIFEEKYSLSLTQIGIITAFVRLLAFITQPTVGYIADLSQTRFFILGGALISIVFMALTGIAPNFGVLLLFISLGSIGASMFHPPSAGMVSGYAGKNVGLSMSIFHLGGMAAFGIGPLFISYYVVSYGLEATPYTMIFGVIVMIYLFKVIPRPIVTISANQGFIKSIKQSLGSVWKPITLIWLIMVLRSFTGQSFHTYLPLLYKRLGYSQLEIGLIISIFVVAGAVSGIVAGHISDKMGYKRVFYVCHALSAPLLYIMLSLSGNWFFIGTFLAGFFIMATLPLGVALAQELAPRGKAMVSSIMMGLAFGTGGMLTPITGYLADQYTIKPILSVLAFIPLLTVVLVYFLPEPKKIN